MHCGLFNMAAVEEDDSDLQNELLAQFQDVTGIDDVEKCKAVLQRHDWNIETAVQDTFNEVEGGAAIYRRDSIESEAEHLPMNIEPSDDDSPSNGSSSEQSVDIHRPNRGLLHWFFSIVFFPIRFTTSIFTDIFRFVVGLVWPSYLHPRTTPVEDVLKFKQDFEAKFGTIHPTFYQGSYSQALTDAKQELRFLLVYLHCEDHQDTIDFCRSTMTNPGFREYVNGNMLFWAVNVKSPEGYRVSNALRESTYPFLALICRRDNRMTVVGRMEGLMTVDQYVALLARLIVDNEPALVAARVDRQERSQAQTLRDEQDEDYRRSLEADQEKERRKREDQEKIMKEEEARRKKEDAIKDKQESLARSRIEKRAQLPDEPDPTFPDAFKVLIKLASGKRLERYFLKSHKLQTLYDYVFCDEETPPEFRLSSHFPRKVYSLEECEDATLESVGIASSATLFVENTAEESDSE